MDERDFADMDNADLDRSLGLDGEDLVCINEHCEFYDDNAHQNCGGDCGGEPAIAFCRYSQNTEPPDTIESLRDRLAAAEQERDEFKESYRLAMVSVNDAYDKGKAFAQKERDEFRTEVERLKHWDSLLCPRCHGVGEITVISGQTPESCSQDNIACPDCVGPIIDRAEQAESALTAAQQSAKEQFRAGVEAERERCVKIVGYYSGTEGICDRILRDCSNCGQDECCHWGDAQPEICGSYVKAGEMHNPGLAAIREAAKEER